MDINIIKTEGDLQTVCYRFSGDLALSDRVRDTLNEGWDPDEHDHLAVAEEALASAVSGYPDSRPQDGEWVRVTVYPPEDGTAEEKARSVRNAGQVLHNLFGSPARGPGDLFPRPERARTVERLAAETVEQAKRTGYMPLEEVARHRVSAYLNAGSGPAHAHLVPRVAKRAWGMSMGAERQPTEGANCPPPSAERVAAEKAIRNPFHLPPGTAPDGHFPLPVMGRVPSDEENA